MAEEVIKMDPFEATYEGEQVCCTCKYFVQHYRQGGEEYWPVCCGHCIEARVKHRAPEKKACERWTPKQEQPPVK